MLSRTWYVPISQGLQRRTYCINPLKPSAIIWLHLHFECLVPSRPNLPFLISDIRALWRSGLSARVPECQKLEMVGYRPGWQSVTI